MFALNGLCAPSIVLYRSTSPVQLLCRLFTSSSSNCDNVGKETRKEYKARYYRENKECWARYYRENNREHHPEKFERYRELSKAKRQRPEYRRREQEYHRQLYADRNYAQRQQMAHWFLHRCPDRDLFQWKSHVPIVYDERIRKTCTSCGRSHGAGARLWWKWRHHASPEKQPDSTGLETRTDSTDHEPYDCHQCYTNGMSDMSRIMPVGHESHVFGIGMKYPEPS